MGGLCNSVASWAQWFFWFAFIAAIVEVVLVFWSKWPRKRTGGTTHEGITAGLDMDGLAKVLSALKDLPPWIAIFLAAMALTWTATSAPGLCT